MLRHLVYFSRLAEHPKYIFSIRALLCFFAATPVYAQTQLDIDRAMELLESQNIAIKQAKVTNLLAGEEYRAARNQRLPTVSLGGGHNYNYGLAFDQVAGQLITGNKWSNMASARISAQAVIFQGFSVRNRIRDARLMVEHSRMEQSGLERSLKLELLATYFDAVANQALYRSSLEKLKYSTEQWRQQREQFDLGTKTLVDVSLAENQVASDELQVLVSGNAYETEILALKQLLDVDYRDSINLVVPVVDPVMVDLTAEQLDAVLSKDPNVTLAELQLKRTELALRTAKSAYLPTISFSGGYGTNYSSESTDFLTGAYMPFWNQINRNRSLNVGLYLSIPVFDGYKTRGEIRRIKLQMQTQEYEIEKVRQERERYLLTERQEYLKTVKEYQVSQRQYESLKTSYEAMKTRYEMGVASSMDYAKSLLDFNTAEFNMIQTKFMLLYRIEALKLLLTS